MIKSGLRKSITDELRPMCASDFTNKERPVWRRSVTGGRSSSLAKFCSKIRNPDSAESRVDTRSPSLTRPQAGDTASVREKERKRRLKPGWRRSRTDTAGSAQAGDRRNDGLPSSRGSGTNVKEAVRHKLCAGVSGPESEKSGAGKEKPEQRMPIAESSGSERAKDLRSREAPERKESSAEAEEPG